MDQQDTKQELKDLNVKLGQAEKDKDAVFFGAILAETLQFRRANGTIVDKATFLADLVKPENRNDELTSDQIKVQLYGSNLAVVTLRVKFSGLRGGQQRKGTFRNIRIFRREPGAQGPWLLHFWFNEGINPQRR
jgi:hypothetical protein